MVKCMKYGPAERKRLEAEEIAREEAINRIAVLVKRYDLRRADLRGIFGDEHDGADARGSKYLVSTPSRSRPFDPFFNP